MNKPLALIIQGSTGVGKTTVAKLFASEYNAACLETDYFMLGMLPYRPLTDQHIRLGSQNLLTCLNRFVEKKLNIVLEGVLLSDPRSDIDLLKLIQFLEKAGYSVHRCKLTAAYETAFKRMTDRPGWEGHDTVISEEVFNQISDTLKFEIPATVPSIVTDGKDAKDVLLEIVTNIKAS